MSSAYPPDGPPPGQPPGPPPGQPPGPPPNGGQGGYGLPAYPPGGNQVPSGKGFFGALFDFSFNEFVTPKIVRFVYVLATAIIALGYVIVVVTSFANDAAIGLLVLLVGAVVAIFYLALIRMTLEFYYSVVRMSQDINRRLPPG